MYRELCQKVLGDFFTKVGRYCDGDKKLWDELYTAFSSLPGDDRGKSPSKSKHNTTIFGRPKRSVGEITDQLMGIVEYNITHFHTKITDLVDFIHRVSPHLSKNEAKKVASVSAILCKQCDLVEAAISEKDFSQSGTYAFVEGDYEPSVVYLQAIANEDQNLWHLIGDLTDWSMHAAMAIFRAIIGITENLMLARVTVLLADNRLIQKNLLPHETLEEKRESLLVMLHYIEKRVERNTKAHVSFCEVVLSYAREYNLVKPSKLDTFNPMGEI